MHIASLKCDRRLFENGIEQFDVYLTFCNHYKTYLSRSFAESVQASLCCRGQTGICTGGHVSETVFLKAAVHEDTYKRNHRYACSFRYAHGHMFSYMPHLDIILNDRKVERYFENTR